MGQGAWLSLALEKTQEIRVWCAIATLGKVEDVLAEVVDELFCLSEFRLIPAEVTQTKNIRHMPVL